MTYDVARPRYTLPLGGKDYELVGTFELIENVEHAMQEGVIPVANRVMPMGVADTAKLLAAMLADSKLGRREIGEVLYAMGVSSEEYALLKFHLFSFFRIILAPPGQREARAKEVGKQIGELARPASPGKRTRGSV